MKAVILCGGHGTRLRETTGGLKPKPMVEIGGRPILWHIMKGYAQCGVNEFVLCLGQLGPVIKHYFLHYEALNSDFTLDIGATESITYHRRHSETNWRVTLADTGETSMTGARLARIRRYVDGERFMLTYGDGVADIDVQELLKHHERHGKVATVTGVRPAGRFGRLDLDGQLVTSFEEKPVGEGGYINGGFFVFEPSIFDYVSPDADCTLEREPLERLARAGELVMYPHNGFWQCMDTYRDLMLLEELWARGNPPWRTWTNGE
jgi:glucose-1-phosphate cytidylyltransferase